MSSELLDLDCRYCGGTIVEDILPGATGCSSPMVSCCSGRGCCDTEGACGGGDDVVESVVLCRPDNGVEDSDPLTTDDFFLPPHRESSEGYLCGGEDDEHTEDFLHESEPDSRAEELGWLHCRSTSPKCWRLAMESATTAAVERW